MLGNIAHQWRQPLNVLGLQIQELPMCYRFGKFTGELLNESVGNSMEIIRHMSQTIDDFQDFLTLNKEKRLFMVAEVIKKSVSIIEAALRDRNMSIDISCTGEPQVILNILMNAKDAFAEQIDSNAQIAVQCRTENDKSVTTITDNARGIKEEIIDKIFDAYFTTKPLGRGTGVGLFMSKAIIEKSMGGASYSAQRRWRCAVQDRGLSCTSWDSRPAL
jgi:signal transduction histidine kinase